MHNQPGEDSGKHGSGSWEQESFHSGRGFILRWFLLFADSTEQWPT